MSYTRKLLVLSMTLLATGLTTRLVAQDDKEVLAKYRAVAMEAGNAERGRMVFESKKAACKKCHVISGKERLAGPDLAVIGDKLTREQLIQSVLEPSATIHPDYATLNVITNDGKAHTGVLRQRTDNEIELFDAEGKLQKIPLGDVDEQHRGNVSLMPTGLFKTVKAGEFADLIAYLTTLRQKEGDAYPGMPAEIPQIAKPVRLQPFHSAEMRFDHPVWFIAKPGTKNEFLVVDQQTRKIWRLIRR